jgi:hypothetical protein
MSKEVKSRATRTPEQVVAQQNADADHDRTKLPVVASTAPPADGFNEPADRNGVARGTIGKCVDGEWNIPSPLVALSTTTCLQRFPKDGGPPETIAKAAGEKLPNPADLNAKIPETEWATGLDGKPRPPWAKNWVVYLLDPKTAEVFTFINSTAGARIAVERLEERVRTMRALRGDAVVPIVELTHVPMKTQWGTKKRPEFKILDWRELGGAAAVPGKLRQIEHWDPTAETVGAPVTPSTVSEELNDSINF